MQSRKGCWRRPSATSNEHALPHMWLKQNTPLKGLHLATKKTGGRSTLIYHARMDNDVLPSGSSGWMAGRWQGTPKKTPQGIFPSFLTSSPQRSTMGMRMTPLGPSQGGSCLPWSEVAPPLPPSTMHSTNSPPIIGASWLRLTGTGQWTNSAKHWAPKSTYWSKSSKQLIRSMASAKGGLKWHEQTDRSATCS